MGKIKKKGAQNSKAVAQQPIHGIKSALLQKNKKPKFKSVSDGGQTTLLNNSKTQNKDKPQKTLQKTTDTKSGRNLLQNNEKELKKEQYSLKEKKNISNKSQNKPADKEIKLNFERNSKERLEVDNSDSDINESVIPQDSLSDRDGPYEEEELDLMISYIDMKRLAYNDKYVNDERHVIIRTMTRASDNLIEIKEEETEGKYVLSYKQEQLSRTYLIIEFNVHRACSETTIEEVKERLEKFGSIKNIEIGYKVPEGLDKNGEVLGRNDKYGGILIWIDYHCPISARKAFSMNGQKVRGNRITVRYRDNLPLFLLDNRKCVCLSNLIFGVDNNTIWKVFSACGEIEYVYLVRDELRGWTTGCGWIVFMTEDAVRKAEVELNGTLLFNTPVIVRANYPGGFFEQTAREQYGKGMTTEEIQTVLAKYKPKQDLSELKKIWKKRVKQKIKKHKIQIQLHNARCMERKKWFTTNKSAKV